MLLLAGALNPMYNIVFINSFPSPVPNRKAYRGLWSLDQHRKHACTHCEENTDSSSSELLETKLSVSETRVERELGLTYTVFYDSCDGSFLKICAKLGLDLASSALFRSGTFNMSTTLYGCNFHALLST